VIPAVIYAAKSTEDTHGSIRDQFVDCRKLAAVRGFDVDGREHEDEAKSAYHGDRGPGLAAAMAECESLVRDGGSCASSCSTAIGSRLATASRRAT
jgi:Resolvase, N terminal domain